MLNIKCIDKPNYIRREVTPFNYILYVCTSCGNITAGTSRISPKGTKFITHTCHNCAANRNFPKNVRIKSYFLQFHDHNWNLILEREFSSWPSD